MIRDAIGVFDKVYSDDYCDALLSFYENRRILGGGDIERRNSTVVSDEAVVLGTDRTLDIFDSTVVGENDAPKLVAEWNRVFWSDCYPAYSAQYPILNDIARHRMGMLKLQRTQPTQGYNTFHCENGKLDSSKRVLFVILYLNDVDEGGETEFLYQSLRVAPVKGTLVLAPTSFTHTHRGNPPLANDKFIATTWLEYIE